MVNFTKILKIEIIAKLNTIVSRKHYKTDKILLWLFFNKKKVIMEIKMNKKGKNEDFRA